DEADRAAHPEGEHQGDGQESVEPGGGHPEHDARAQYVAMELEGEQMTHGRTPWIRLCRGSGDRSGPESAVDPGPGPISMSLWLWTVHSVVAQPPVPLWGSTAGGWSSKPCGSGTKPLGFPVPSSSA